MVTMADIARIAGVSQPTVSRVLNGKGVTERISAETQKKIRDIARQLQFRPSAVGRALVSGKTRSIGFICGNIRNPHYAEMADMAMELIEQRGYHLIMSVTRWANWQNDLECFDSLMSRGVDGVIFFGSALAQGRAQYERVVREEFPLVCINYHSPGLPCIQFDAQPGMNEAVALLQANGHSRIMSMGLDDPKKRIPLLQAAGRQGILVEEGPTFPCERPRRDEELLRNVRTEAHRFAERKDRPSSVFVSSDYLARAFIAGLWDNGIVVPRDVSVIGFDGTQAGEDMAPPLTSIAQDHEGIVRGALEMIFERIEQKTSAAPVVTLPTKLIVRQSVGPNPNA